MIIVMEKHTADQNIERVTADLVRRGFDVHRSTGSDQAVLGVVGRVDTLDTREFELFDGVQEVVRVSEPYKLSSAHRSAPRSGEGGVRRPAVALPRPIHAADG